ncbi:MAG: NAD-dependent epimerase/dehydratase family protein [Thermoanaerobaculia bacterium]|nr:NAD-dependent epimerase/dehydratase family protein [Thermoanaerobaculia bacterium]
MRCLITGGAGFIGSHTADALMAAGHEVRVLDALRPPVHMRPVRPPWLHDDAELIHGDVRDRAVLNRALEGVDAIFHLAAYQDYLPDFSTFFDVNASGTALLFELLVERRQELRRLVVASSQAVAGEGSYRDGDGQDFVPSSRSRDHLAEGRWEISDAMGRPATALPTPEIVSRPQNPYGLSKWTQERLVLDLAPRYGIPAVAMRYSIVQGPRQSFTNAYSGACRIFCLASHFDRPITIYEDGLQRRDFVDIEDVVQANLLVLEDERAIGGVFNVGGERAYTVLEFADLVQRAFDRQGTLEPSGRFRFGDTRHAVSDCTALHQLGWRPTRTPADSVAAYRDWLRSVDPSPAVLDDAAAEMERLGVVRGG